MRGRVIWGNISRSVNGENVLGGVAYKNKYIYIYMNISQTKNGSKTKCIYGMEPNYGPKITCAEFGAKMFVRVRDTAVTVVYS